MEDFATVKYSPAGETLWARRYDGAAHGEDEAYVIVLDDSDNVYVTGGSAETTGCWGCLTYSAIDNLEGRHRALAGIG